MFGHDDTHRRSGARLSAGAQITGDAHAPDGMADRGLEVVDAFRVVMTDASARPAVEIDARAGLVFAALFVRDGDVDAVMMEPREGVASARLPVLPNGAECVVIVIAYDRADVLQRLLKERMPSGSLPWLKLMQTSSGAARAFEAYAAPAPPPPMMAEPPAMAEMAEMAEPELAEPVLAHIAAEMPARLVEQREFVLTVRLGREVLTPTAGTAHAEDVVPIDPDEPVVITVSARGIQLADGEDAVHELELPASAAVASTTFRLLPVDVGRGVVSIAVRQGDIQLPLTTFRLSAAVLPAGTALADEPPIETPGRVVGRPAEIADLPTIRIDEILAGGESTLRIAVSVAGKKAQTFTQPIGNKADFVAEIYDRLTAIRTAVAGIADDDERRDAALARLRVVGQWIAGRLFDASARSLLWKHREKLTGLIVQTGDELDVPWEIVHLVPPEGEDDALPWFLADVGLTRWVYDASKPVAITIDPSRVIAFAPEYTSQSLRLARAGAEIEGLRALLPGAQPEARDATTAQLRERIAAGFDLLHFAGHGRWRDIDPRGQQVALASFDPAATDDEGTYNEAQAREDVPEWVATDSEPPPTMVFLSACDVGRLQSGTPGLGGFAEAFLRGGAGVFIGCNWPVADDVASRFVAAFYDAALTGRRTVGAATLEARTKAREAGDLTALAFTVFADPRTTLAVL